MQDEREQKIKISFETNADETAKKVDNVNTKLDGTSKETEKVSKSQKQAADTSGNLVKNLEGLNNPISSAISGFKAMIVQMWKIVTNPLGLILVAIVGSLTLLFKAFTSTKAGAEAFDRVMAGISATIDVVRDRVLKIGEALVKFFSGDFKGAIELGREAVSGFGEEVAREFRAAADATRSLQEVTDAMRDMKVARSELNKDLADAKELISDETAAYNDKKAAIDKIRIAEEKQTAQELANAQKRLAALETLANQSDSDAKTLDELADAKIAVNELLQRQSDIRRNLNRQEKRIDNEERARLKALADERKARAKEAEEARQRQLDQEFKFATEQQRLAEKIAAEKKDRARKLQEEEEAEQQARFDREIKALKAKAAEELRIEKEQADAKLKLQEQLEFTKISITDKALNLFSNLAGKNKKLQKAAIIAEGAVALGRTKVNTAQGNAAALALGIAQAGPVAGPGIAAPAIKLNTLSGVLSGASIIANTATALKSLGGGSLPGAGGSEPAGATGGGATNTPQVSFQASSENQIANTIAQQTNDQPIQAYVVESDVSTAQQLASNRIRSNSI